MERYSSSSSNGGSDGGTLNSAAVCVTRTFSLLKLTFFLLYPVVPTMVATGCWERKWRLADLLLLLLDK